MVVEVSPTKSISIAIGSKDVILVDDIESVQRRATAIIHELKNLSYSERLQKIGLPTLAYRRAARARGEMIEVYKITRNIYDDRVTTNFLTMKDKNKYMGLNVLNVCMCVSVFFCFCFFYVIN